MNPTEQRLAEAERRLAELEAEYREFAHIVSHDLGAQLRTIKGFAEMLSDGNAQRGDEDIHEQLRFIQSGAHQADAMLEALLLYSRLDSRPETVAEVDVAGLIDRVTASLAEQINETDAAIEVAVALPAVRAAPRHLELVFFHLLQNALLYRADDRTPRISIGGEDGAEAWQFGIADNGMGVPPHALEKIFKPLRRAVGSAYPGVGMGLAVAKKVVHRHGGQIGVEAGPGVGSRFYFTLAKCG